LMEMVPIRFASCRARSLAPWRPGDLATWRPSATRRAYSPPSSGADRMLLGVPQLQLRDERTKGRPLSTTSYTCTAMRSPGAFTTCSCDIHGHLKTFLGGCLDQGDPNSVHSVHSVNSFHSVIMLPSTDRHITVDPPDGSVARTKLRLRLRLRCLLPLFVSSRRFRISCWAVLS
jgi:hypothetical protein